MRNAPLAGSEYVHPSSRESQLISIAVTVFLLFLPTHLLSAFDDRVSFPWKAQGMFFGAHHIWQGAGFSVTAPCPTGSPGFSSKLAMLCEKFCLELPSCKCSWGEDLKGEKDKVPILWFLQGTGRQQHLWIDSGIKISLDNICLGFHGVEFGR